MSAEGGLKNAEAQAKDQRKLLYTTEIELATQKQLVLNLKAELLDAAWVTKEASKAVEKASYERGVLDMETRLAEEVARVCRDYYTKVWTKALNRAGVSVDSELRSARNIFFPKDIREFPTELPPPVTLPLPPPEQSLTIQDSSLDVEVLVEASKVMEV